jgi:glycine dehydrogenase
VQNPVFFDTLQVAPRIKPSEVKLRAIQKKINLRYFPDGTVGVSLDESVTQGWTNTVGSSDFSIASTFDFLSLLA